DPVLIAGCEDGFVHITAKFALEKMIVLGGGTGKERAENLAEAVLPVGDEPAFHFRSSQDEKYGDAGGISFHLRAYILLKFLPSSPVDAAAAVRAERKKPI